MPRIVLPRSAATSIRPVMLFAALAVMPSLLPVIGFAQEAATQAPKTIPSAIELEDGDTLVFLGDSITHQRLYTQYVEDFFFTRFPDRRIRFHNAGIGGAQAWDALQRIERDVTDYRPKYVTILLGMNDGRYRPFDVDVFNTYQQDMTAVVERIRQAGATPILMSPTMYDARQGAMRKGQSKEMLSQYNSVLAYYGRWLQDVALNEGLSYVDMYGPLNSITLQQRKQDATFTMIRDSVHPDPPGQLVMAFAMIEDLGLRKGLSSIRILPAARDNLRAVASGGEVTNLQKTESGIAFDWMAEALPWVVPAEAQSGADLVKLGHKASREALQVHGLAPGQYELKIDGETVGKWSDVALAGHIELQSNDRTPQYRQAMEVVLLNKERNEGPVKALRDSWGLFQNWARTDRAAQQQPENQEIAAKAAELKSQLEGLEARIQESEAASAVILDRIHEASQPALRHFELVRVATAAPARRNQKTGQ